MKDQKLELKQKIAKQLSNTKKIAKDIYISIVDNTDICEFDFEWDLSDGKMISNAVNTSIKFDFPTNSILKPILLSIEQIEDVLSDEDYDILSGLFQNISEDFRSNYLEKLKPILRNKVLGDAPENVFPMEEIKLVSIDIGNKPPCDYVIVVQRMVPQDVIADGGKSGKVTEELGEIHTTTGKDLNDIIAEFKENGNDRFKYVTSAYKRQYWFECQLNLWVDYSTI